MACLAILARDRWLCAPGADGAGTPLTPRCPSGADMAMAVFLLLLDRAVTRFRV